MHGDVDHAFHTPALFHIPLHRTARYDPPVNCKSFLELFPALAGLNSERHAILAAVRNPFRPLCRNQHLEANVDDYFYEFLLNFSDFLHLWMSGIKVHPWNGHFRGSVPP